MDVKAFYEKAAPLSIKEYGQIIQSCSPSNLYSFLKEIGKALGLKTSSHVLDIGCGTGKIAFELNKDFGCRVLGIDNCEFNIKYAEERFVTEKTHFSLGDMNDLKNITKKFDVLMSFETVGYAANLSNFLTKCNELLPIKGKLLIKTYSPSLPKSPIFTNKKTEMLGYKVWKLSELLLLAEMNNFILKEYKEISFLACTRKDENFYRKHGIETEAEFAQVPIPFWIILEKQEDL